MDQIPDGSLYFWMYKMGLKKRDLGQLVSLVESNGRQLRQKDIDNYWNGYNRSWLYSDGSSLSGHDMFCLKTFEKPKPFLETSLEDYPVNPAFGRPEIEERWVPCNSDNKPLIKWGNGCMSMDDAMAYTHQKYLAENTKGTSFIIIDCDGDHDEELDIELIRFLYPMTKITHTLYKPKLVTEYEGYKHSDIDVPASFHLTFTTDRIIPTMHFPSAHMDIIGNKCNSLRYRKNKVWNGMMPKLMTDTIWEMLKAYVKEREK